MTKDIKQEGIDVQSHESWSKVKQCSVHDSEPTTEYIKQQDEVSFLIPAKDTALHVLLGVDHILSLELLIADHMSGGGIHEKGRRESG